LPPPRAAPAIDWRFYNSQKLLHLIPGDKGYVAWLAALHAFYNDIEAEITCYYGNRSTTKGVEMLGVFKDLFPVILDKL
jgi:hypothetical protein